jgi:hypothetical protein
VLENGNFIGSYEWDKSFIYDLQNIQKSCRSAQGQAKPKTCECYCGGAQMGVPAYPGIVQFVFESVFCRELGLETICKSRNQQIVSSLSILSKAYLELPLDC